MMSIKVINPFSEKMMAQYAYESDLTIETKAQKAHDQFKVWKKLSLSERSKYFLRLNQILSEKVELLATLISSEMGKPILEARAEIQKCQSGIKIYLENGEEWLKTTTVLSDGKSHEIEYRPMGVILAIMPWNFPFWQFFRCAIPAILAGNTILLKHAEQTTGSALMIAEIFNDAGFPQGVMQTIVASHIDTEKLLRGRIVQGLSFTGSTKAGKHLAAIAAVNLKKVVMELGGSDPMIILENVDIVWAAKIAFTARHQNNGETCIAAKRLIIAENIYSQFISEYKKLMNNISFGNPLEEKTTMGPLVNDQAKKNFESMIIDASDLGAKITRREHQQNSGYFFAPCLVENVTSKMRVWVEETFAPITVIRTYKTVDEAIALANHSDFGLGASVLGNDIELCKKISTELEAGVIFINNIVKSDAKLPFGGTKSSGIGRELADLGLGEFCHVTTVNVY